ncbi:hypothetical protein F4805DRAFT_354188 [Annulohypoxylon moriforme]|nr:hypothetical protein F4805DRAFT_354188 [Annulohypoxylon moriforme]
MVLSGSSSRRESIRSNFDIEPWLLGHLNANLPLNEYNDPAYNDTSPLTSSGFSSVGPIYSAASQGFISHPGPQAISPTTNLVGQSFISSTANYGQFGHQTQSIGFNPHSGVSDLNDAAPAVPALFLSPGLPPPKQKRRYICDICQAPFGKNNDLERHKRTVHRTEAEPVYRCRCDHESPRKDNYLRHVVRCARPPYHLYYSCKCGILSEDKGFHVSHVTTCQYRFGFPGRPPMAL